MPSGIYERKRRDPVERFWEKVDRSGDCWLWTSQLVGRREYGLFWSGQRNVLAHRFAYELLVGPISEGYELDHRHTCPGKCVNPDHLRPVTHKQNLENRPIFSNSKSGVRGVSWNKSSGRWIAKVGHDNKSVYVGSFKAIEDAEAAVIAKRNELFTHNDLDRVKPVLNHEKS
jgi:hypothetical protein